MSDPNHTHYQTWLKPWQEALRMPSLALFLLQFWVQINCINILWREHFWNLKHPGGGQHIFYVLRISSINLTWSLKWLNRNFIFHKNSKNPTNMLMQLHIFVSWTQSWREDTPFTEQHLCIQHSNIKMGKYRCLKPNRKDT